MARKKASIRKKRTKPRVKKAAKRKAPKRVARKKKAAPAKRKGLGPLRTPEATLEKIGEVTHYFPKVRAAAVMIKKDSLKVGDKIYIKGHTTNFKEKVMSIQLDRAPIQEGRKGQEIGLLVKSRVRIGDSVYRV